MAKKKAKKTGTAKTKGSSTRKASAAKKPEPCGGICYLEIPAPDLKGAMAFYRKVFGWSSTEFGPEYAMFSTPMGCGGFDPSAAVSDKGVCLYIQVEDIPSALRKVQQQGGSVVRPKTKISDEHGFYGLFKDSCGNRLGVWCQH